MCESTRKAVPKAPPPNEKPRRGSGAFAMGLKEIFRGRNSVNRTIDRQTHTGEQAPKPRFGPVPCRAISDQRLSGSEFRVLAAIGAHDGLGMNGRGCDAGRTRLAYLCGINLATFSKSVRLLEILGYVSVEGHPTDGRRRVWRVIYTADDGVVMSSRHNPTDEKWVASRQPNSSYIGGDTATQMQEIGCLINSQVSDFTNEPKPNIFCETDNKFPERANKFAGMRGSSGCSVFEGHHSTQNHRSLKSRICETERLWREKEIDSATAVERLTDLLEESEEVTESNHIERIFGDIELAEGRV